MYKGKLKGVLELPGVQRELERGTKLGTSFVDWPMFTQNFYIIQNIIKLHKSYYYRDINWWTTLKKLLIS